MDVPAPARTTDMRGAQLGERLRRDLRKPAKNSVACEISQPVKFHRLVFFRGRLTKKHFQLGAGLRRCERTLPRFITLLSQEETREVGDLELFLQRQRFANADDFLSGRAHACQSSGERSTVQLGSATSRRHRARTRPGRISTLFLIEVELVALRRVAPRSAAQRTGGRLRSIQRPPGPPAERGRSCRSATTATFSEQCRDAPTRPPVSSCRLLFLWHCVVTAQR